MNDIIGIEVLKDKLDIFDLERKEHRQFAKDTVGLASPTNGSKVNVR